MSYRQIGSQMDRQRFPRKEQQRFRLREANYSERDSIAEMQLRTQLRKRLKKGKSEIRIRKVRRFLTGIVRSVIGAICAGIDANRWMT